MNAELLRQFFHRSREWARATRGLELMHMAAAALQEFADVDSGFFIYQRRFNASQEKKPLVFAPWGVFLGCEAELQRLLEKSLQELEVLNPFIEHWRLPEDMPSDVIREHWSKYPLLEYGIWPITSREQIIGAIVVARSKSVSSRLSPQMSHAIVDASAAQVSVALDLILSKRIAEQASERDMLTGLLNRRGLETRFPDIAKRAQSANSSLIVIVIDMDDLKGVNDAYGHPTGDEALRQIAKLIKGCLSEEDLVCRYGGDEFIVAHLTDRPDIDGLVRCLEGAVAKHSSGFQITAGGSLWNVEGNSLEECYRLADERLYERKRHKESTFSS